jgi:predicted transposase YbfD/YdcC
MANAQSPADRAYDQVIEWLEHFEDLEDPRQSGKVAYPLDEMLLQCLFAVLAGAESWVEIAEFGKKKLDFLRRFAEFAEGTPSHDQFGNLFAALDAEAFQGCFIAWVASLTKLGPDIVAIDGKTLRRSYQVGGAKAPIHMISAFSSRQRMVLGQRKVADKSNEITAIPELLDLLTVKGAIVTIDAMGCQTEIASKIVSKGGDYVLALKGNQGTLRDDVELFFNEQKERRFADAVMSRHETLEKSHGRIETRTYSAIEATGWLTKRHGFADLKSLVMVESIREIIGGKTERETRYYISSLAADAVRQGDAKRRHWAVESHHSFMDMVFRDDECRIRRDNTPANFATIKHIASNLMRAKVDKKSMRVKRRLAAWDDAYLESLVTGLG